MPRNGSGTYTLPQAAFVTGSTISSTVVNSDFSDIASALTASISADGQTPITGPLRFADGVVATPSISFTTETTTGLIRSGAGKIGIVGAGILSSTFDTATIGTTGNQFAYGNGAIPVPVGAVQDFAGTTAPMGWLLLFGQVLATATYPELSTVCGTTYNTGGEGAGNFRLPDCRGTASYGKDNMGGVAANRITVAGGNFDGTVLGGRGGLQKHTLIIDETPAHDHGGATGTVNPTLGSFLANTAAWAPGGNQRIQVSNANGGDSTINFSTVSGTIAGATGAIAPQGGNLPHTILSPAIVFNKIIFAGRP